jgi:Spy/CpxP family protein refolding chaperone
MEQKHITAMQTHLAALKTFYAVLTPEQQATLNKEMAHFGHHGKRQWHNHSDTPPSSAPSAPAAQH